MKKTATATAWREVADWLEGGTAAQRDLERLIRSYAPDDAASYEDVTISLTPERWAVLQETIKGTSYEDEFEDEG